MDGSAMRQFEELVSQHQRELINFHYRFVGNRSDAEDLAQETFIRAYLKFGTLKEPAKFKGWLMSIARNLVIDFFRKNRERNMSLDDPALEHVAQVADVGFQDRAVDAQVARELERCIDQLVREDRAIIKLLYYEGFSYQEIGELLHMNQNTLKSRLHRARKVLLTAIRGSASLRDTVLEYSHGTE